MRRFLKKYSGLVVGLQCSLLSLTGCQFKPLYIEAESPSSHINVSISDISLDLIWGINWHTEWLYQWNEEISGPVGYTLPDYVCAQFYPLDAAMVPLACRVSHFAKSGGELDLAPGYYNALFYNDDVETILFSDANVYSNFVATATVNRNAFPSTRTGQSRNQPDLMYGVYVPGLHVPDDPSEYELVDGVYIYRIDEVLEPYVYIYLVQVVLNNNEEGTVTGAEEIHISGLSEGVNLFTRQTLSDTILVTVEPKALQHHEGYDVIGGRMQTFGLCDIDPLYTRAYTRSDVENRAEVTLRLHNGNLYTLSQEITGQLVQQLTGGILTITVDVNDIPQEVKDDRQENAFDVNVKDWEGEDNYEMKV